MIQRVASAGTLLGASRTAPHQEENMRKIIALGLWLGADTLEVIRGGLLAAAVALIGEE